MKKNNDLPSFISRAINLAEKIQNLANELTTPEDKKIQKQMINFLVKPEEKVLFVQLIDQGLRPKNRSRVAERINHFLKGNIPGFFTFSEKLLARLFLIIGRFFPSISVPIMINEFQKKTSHLVLSDGKEDLLRHIKKRKNEKIMMNINHLGEAVLGNGEAVTRLNNYVQDLKRPEIEFISVKASGVMSQIQPIAFDFNVNLFVERLSKLFKTALDHKKIVNLDMEDFRHIDLTVTSFIKTLDQREFFDLSAGIALQSYIPDSFLQQQRLTSWAKNRVSNGGAPIKIRLVKGANLEMEKIESGLKGWPVPIYRTKLDVDANFKRMIDFGFIYENINAVRLGIATHNIFEMSYAYIMAQEKDQLNSIVFEMLEGMSNNVRNALKALNKNNKKGEAGILLYAPVVSKESFITAMAYLVRRMDENTREENFIRFSFDLEVGSQQWNMLKNQFVESYKIRNEVNLSSFRIQDRMSETGTGAGFIFPEKFVSEIDTDWSLQPNHKWAEEIRSKWKRTKADSPIKVPLVIGGNEIFDNRKKGTSLDLSRINENIIISEHALADSEDIENAVLLSQNDPDRWRHTPHTERKKILSNIAVEIRKSRADLMGSMAATTGKVFTEADVEVSEAVDFAEFYPYSVDFIKGLEGIKTRSKGVVIVIPPWNFPVAIPAGGMLAALASGNTVIIKPSSDSVLPAWILCNCFWRAGISKNTLQFLPSTGSKMGNKLTGHPGVDFIIFTGGTDTALNIIKGNPAVSIAAETGGKNGTIVTVMADYDQAIDNIIHSAFSNCGQKCSATSLLILDKNLFHDEKFKKQLVDAVETYSTGSVWDFRNRMGPLIRPPSGNLKKGLEELSPGESWLVKPENIENNPHLWRPCIKWNVKPGSYSHITEFFGPMLSVMCAGSLDEAIEMVNSTGYGLTSGLESLDEREQEKWKNLIKAGNLYINRVTTGAVVPRQPFGGMGRSAFGSGIKAGGFNYVLQLMDYIETGPPHTGIIKNSYEIKDVVDRWKGKLEKEEWLEFKDDIENTILATNSYLYNFEQEFSIEKDYFKHRGQDNITRYLTVGDVAVRVHESDSLFSILARIAATRISRCNLIVSLAPDINNEIVDFIMGDGMELIGNSKVLKQTDMELCDFLPEIDRIRYSSPHAVPEIIYKKASKTGFYISRTPVLMEGRIELLQYFKEQCISFNYHRYGNLGMRGLEE